MGRRPTALAVGAGGGLFGHFFSHLSLLLAFSLSLGDGPIWTEILSQRAVKPKTTNQPNPFQQYFRNIRVTGSHETPDVLFSSAI